jgi:hypothetical protein
MELDKYVPYVGLALALASMVLHFFAPRTKNTADDKVLEVVEDKFPAGK